MARETSVEYCHQPNDKRVRGTIRRKTLTTDDLEFLSIQFEFDIRSYRV